MPTNDRQLTKEDIGQLENVAQIIHFFAQLGYDVDDAIPLDHASLGMDSEDLRQQIRQLHRIASDPDEELIVYFLHVRSVTVALTQTIARRFRERVEDSLLVLTKDFETFDFVLLDKELAKGTTRGKALRQIIRPRALTVNRRNPDPVALRVLKRFTFTEADGIYQWEKLRAAYDVAEWAEPEFNNRALFSDYYLKNRLNDPKLTPAWAEDVRPIGRRVHQLLSHARQTYSRQPEQVVRDGLYEPLFRELGFELAPVKPGTSSEEEADYKLFTPGRLDKPVALALTYVWNRSLDDKDETRDPHTPEEIPGTLVVSVLENSDVPWVIMTNGKLWRLYSATASNKATNYYEIDLEEALAAPDQVTALKYWWLFFRQDAFTGFLDELLQQSADYAKGLGDRLKDRVFTEIFPHFAAGFIHQIRAEAGHSQANFNDEALQWVYEGTLTFLYRLMFVLYAESLELLPLAETRGYRALSLNEMKRGIAAQAGDILDEAPDKLKQAYSTVSTGLYERLTELFTVIDTGSDVFNLPTYNGGLFSRGNENGQFLAEYKIPDRHLALGLDRLCRDVDEKTQALVFIDYKSLGVRHLGSIYEGLLEFKLHIAPEELAVIKEKGKEVYQPVAAISQSRRVQTTITKGTVYLENDKKERKATGSYYTPDYIVKYIVENTVGPVLARKFEVLAPRLREAQKQYRDHEKRVQARGNDQPPQLFWNELPMRQLADDCLNVRVLDPAMGSGHFLVEAVDFVSNRLIDFLNGWSDNPVWALLERTRDDIVADMERQRVTIDAARLTRVALLKRAVLKRCVYGVDLNLMAVELAKLSLWLDAFTLGAPLSFLDHHLKQGNSLIGARIEEARAVIEGTEETAVQLSLFSKSHFTGMKMAVDAMRRVSFLSDNTVAQVQESHNSYQDALAFLEPFKRVLDVYTSRWFGNTLEQKRKGITFDPAVQLLQHPNAEMWLKNPQTRLQKTGGADWQQVADTALSAASEKNFFHWELEFPEVFFAPSKPGGQDVQLNPDGGFDAVVGNPPYDVMEKAVGDTRTEALNRFVEYLNSNPIYEPALGGKLNIFRFFVVLWLAVSQKKGRFGLIIPLSIATDLGCSELRKYLVTQHSLQAIDAFPDRYNPSERVFEDAKTSVAILTGVNEHTQNNTLRIQTRHGASLEVSPMTVAVTPESISTVDNHAFTYPLTSQALWDLMVQIHQNPNIVRLSKIAEVGAGEIHLTYYRPFFTDNNSECEVVRGAELQRFELASSLSQGAKLYLSIGEAKKHLNPRQFDEYRIGMQRLTGTEDRYRFLATLIEPGVQLAHTTQFALPKTPYHAAYLLAVLSSHLIDQRFRITSGTTNVGVYEVEQLPFPFIHFNTSTDLRERQANQITSAYANDDKVAALQQVQAALVARQSDVVHDVLAYLAQTMIDLNRQKQAEVKRFLGWLENRLNIMPKDGKTGLDVFTGKTIIQGYLGDYQKDELELPWDDFFYRLHQNRNRFKANLAQVKGQIQAEYEQSLAILLPIKQQLAATDTLIDQIVYKLYGLTDEEIELIERPAYEQALSSAKEAVVKDKKLQKDPEAAAAAIAQTVLPAAKRLQSRIPQQDERARLDQDLPGWQQLPGDVPTFLLSGEYDLATRPEHLDFSATVISFAKAVENSLYARLFLPFRDQSGCTDADCRNKFLQQFMRGEKHLTLGSFPIIMASSKESALRQFAAGQFGDAAALFSPSGLLGLLQDEAAVRLRNKAAHDELLTKDDARNGREWALAILRFL